MAGSWSYPAIFFAVVRHTSFVGEEDVDARCTAASLGIYQPPWRKALWILPGSAAHCAAKSKMVAVAVAARKAGHSVKRTLRKHKRLEKRELRQLRRYAGDLQVS